MALYPTAACQTANDPHTHFSSNSKGKHRPRDRACSMRKPVAERAEAAYATKPMLYKTTTHNPPFTLRRQQRSVSPPTKNDLEMDKAVNSASRRRRGRGWLYTDLTTGSLNVRYQPKAHHSLLFPHFFVIHTPKNTPQRRQHDDSTPPESFHYPLTSRLKLLHYNVHTTQEKFMVPILC